mmetsp:Transcript_148310/g.369728  ORF Transcript_148310/g.369728 Transcript_148310/m.369728 type:complete len:209 (+) Transcript_148310:388-1014(+)
MPIWHKVPSVVKKRFLLLSTTCWSIVHILQGSRTSPRRPPCSVTEKLGRRKQHPCKLKGLIISMTTGWSLEGPSWTFNFKDLLVLQQTRSTQFDSSVMYRNTGPSTLPAPGTEILYLCLASMAQHSMAAHSCFTRIFLAPQKMSREMAEFPIVCCEGAPTVAGAGDACGSWTWNTCPGCTFAGTWTCKVLPNGDWTCMVLPGPAPSGT